MPLQAPGRSYIVPGGADRRDRGAPRRYFITGDTLAFVPRVVALVQEYSLPLICGIFAGLLVANFDHHLYEQLVEYQPLGSQTSVFGHALTVHFLINGVFMVFFFGTATKEITDSVLPGGVLNPIRTAVNPLLGTVGGVLGPAFLYLLLTYIFYGGTDDFSVVANGWGIPTATDIALAWLVARLVFGNGHPAVNFLLLLAVADDGIGLGIIAVFYSDPELPIRPVWLLLVVGAMGVAWGMRRLNVRSWVPYIAVAGLMSWVGLLQASIEPALALAPVVPFLPSNPHGETEDDAGLDTRGMSEHVATHRHSPLEQFEHHLKLFVDLGLFFFAFTNAGVGLGSINTVTALVLASLIVGKTVGIAGFSIAGTWMGFPLPNGMGIRHLAIAGLIAGIGLTVALFVAGKAFPGPPFQDPAKMGAVLSGLVAFLALGAGAALKVKDGSGPNHK